jgi:hypothetical protein
VTQATNWVMMAMVEISLQEQMNVAFRKKKQEKMHVHSDGQLLRSANLPRCCGTMMKSSGWSFVLPTFRLQKPLLQKLEGIHSEKPSQANPYIFYFQI